MTSSGTGRGFTLAEVAVSLAVMAAVGASVVPALDRNRQEGHATASADNLRKIGAGAMQYARDNRSQIFSYNWEGQVRGVPYTVSLPNGLERRVRDNISAAQAQNTEILMRRTGRLSGDDAIVLIKSQYPQKRMIGLVLSDAMEHALPDPMFVDPADANQVGWMQNPTSWGEGSGVPYSTEEERPGYDDPKMWAVDDIRQRWAFTSSYQVTQFAWHRDGTRPTDAYARPYAETPHLLSHGRNARAHFSDFKNRRMTQVKYPAQKVYFFEEFDREGEGDPFFAYDQARPEKLMFDGSVNSWASGDAGSSVDPGDRGSVWKQVYVPLDTFPEPLGGLGDETMLDMRYRWTDGGLGGFDYGGSAGADPSPE